MTALPHLFKSSRSHADGHRFRVCSLCGKPWRWWHTFGGGRCEVR